MLSLTPTQVRRVRYCVVGAAVGLPLGSVGACSFLLDHGVTECQTDSDCLNLGVHPSCQSGVCVNTGIPCFDGVPDGSNAFLNQCSTGDCPQFNDCARLGVCGDDDLPDVIAPPPTDAGTDAAFVNGSYPNCSEMMPGTGGTIYITGSSNFPVLLSQIAPQVLNGSPPLTQGPAMVWLTTSSCQGADAIFSPDAAANIIHDPPRGSAPTAYAQYYLADGGSTPCLLGEAGMPVDIGESDVFSTTCDMSYMITNQTDTLGPNEAMEFVVPELSLESTISREAAREVFGIGGNDAGASPNITDPIPWTNYQRYYVRNSKTGTQQMIAKDIGVPAGAFWGIDRGSAANVLSDLQNLSSLFEAEQAIGILSNDVYDSSRSNLKALAYQETGQNCAYLPDSTASSYDKQNLRDGHYPIWGPLHFFTSNQPTAQVNSFLNYVNGAQTAPGVLDAFIEANLVPNCAMTVLRSGNTELGPLASFQPEASCACYFVVNAGPSGNPRPPECTPCGNASDCPPSRPACNFGYCEVQ
jgi:hypothetical protein